MLIGTQERRLEISQQDQTNAGLVVILAGLLPIMMEPQDWRGRDEAHRGAERWAV